jgi:hypothetical protein
MITIKPWAQFRADFPSDIVEEGGQIVQFGGRNVAEAMAEILRSLGCKVSEPINAEEHGWELDIRCEQIPLWAQISDLNPTYYFLLEDNRRLFGKSNPPIYLHLLQKMNDRLETDHRFHDIFWYDAEDFNMERGSDRPVIGEVPEIKVTKIKVTKIKLSFLDKLLAPLKPPPWTEG